jgi:glycosyltransferase involved in cell wall biosynthesis
MTLRSLAIAAPAFNEADGIATTVSSWIDALASRPQLEHAEIVVCDDGSTDATGSILDALASAAAHVRPVHHARNRGAARAMATAIAHTSAEWVLLLDADGQFPIALLDRFERALADHPDAVAFIGERTQKRDDAFARTGARLTTAALNALHGTAYRDLSSACQLVRGDVLRAIPIEARGLNYSVEISARLLEGGLRPVAVPIAHRAREGGRSSRTLLRSSAERAAFVTYFAMRRALIGYRVISPSVGGAPPCTSR